MAVRARGHQRIAIRLPNTTTPHQHRELGAFVHYCIVRVERDLGEHEAWSVEIGPSLGGYASHIAVEHRGVTVEDQGNGLDGTLATWDAMCRIEQRLRELRR